MPREIPAFFKARNDLIRAGPAQPITDSVLQIHWQGKCCTLYVTKSSHLNLCIVYISIKIPPKLQNATKKDYGTSNLQNVWLTEISPKMLNVDLENVLCCMKKYKTLIPFAPTFGSSCCGLLTNAILSLNQDGKCHVLQLCDKVVAVK